MRKLNQIIFSIFGSAFDNLTRPNFASRPDNFFSEIDLPARPPTASPDLFVMTEVTMQGRGIIVKIAREEGRALVMVTSPRLLTNGQDFLHHYFCPRHTESNRTEVICSDISYGTQERDQVKLFFLAIIH